MATFCAQVSISSHALKQIIVSDRLLRGAIVAIMDDMLNSYLKNGVSRGLPVTRRIMGVLPNRIPEYFYGGKLGHLVIERRRKMNR